MKSAMELGVVDGVEKATMSVKIAGADVLRSASRVVNSAGDSSGEGYDSVTPVAGGYLCAIDSTLADGTAVQMEDRWLLDGPARTIHIERSISIEQSGSAAGVRVELDVDSALDVSSEMWELFIPGALYNRNDTNQDGEEDYLGGFVQEYRDDRNGQLAVMAFSPNDQTAVSLSRVSLPESDFAIPPAELLDGQVIQNTDIGSLGIVLTDNEPLTFRAGFPFREERSFALDTSGRGWAGFMPNVQGTTAVIRYEVRVFDAPDLTEAIWNVTSRQRHTLNAAPSPLVLPLEELEEHRFALTQSYFKSWNADEDPRLPAGYMTHFSPRTGDTLGSLLEFGFTGAQTLLALAAIRRGHEQGAPQWISEGRAVNDFFVKQCQHENGYSEGLYDTNSQRFVQWFTGILMPFQYANDDEELKKYLGSQITESLAPIARELRNVDGNYTRTMCEAVHAVLLAYEDELEHGSDQTEWLAAGEKLGQFLLRTQEPDGSWFRGYSPDGEPLTHPVEWFGSSLVEQRSGTIFPIPVLSTLFRITGEPAYLDALTRAADFILDTYVPGVLYCGGLNDTAHVKSVKMDSTGAMFAMRSLMVAYNNTHDRRHLEGAVKAAKAATSWVFYWNVPFPPGTLLQENDFRTTGWVVCDALPAGSYVEDVFLEFVGDLLDIAVHAKIPEFVDIAELIMNGMQQGLSVPSRMLGYSAPGIQCEGFMTSYWLSAPEESAFSGAVGKVKGDDNDTCNGFVNGAAFFGLDTMRRTYGTLSFATIRELTTRK